MKMKYLSKSDVEILKQNNQIPENFDVEEHNKKVIDTLYQEYQEYFSHMYDGIDENIKLDEEQIKAILCDEDYSLIIAGAGTGKTTTMASKVKYLVDKKQIDPDKILVMSFTKKATEELENRIVYDFKIPAKVTTFHSLGMMYLRQIYENRKCYPVGDDEKNKIFLKYFKEQVFPDKEKLKNMLEVFSSDTMPKTFLFAKFFKNNYEKYSSFDDFFEAYKKDKLSQIPDIEFWIKDKIDRMINAELPRTIKNELVKSKKEALIANFLFCNSIEYEYEKIYEELMDDERTYKPDFTLNIYGENVYLEYFGISYDGSTKSVKYLENKKQKEEYHKLHETKFIALEPTNDEELIKVLEKKLLETGFSFKKRNSLEIYHQLMNNNPISQLFGFKNFLFEMISFLKTPDKRLHYVEIVENYVRNLPEKEQIECSLQFKYINEFYHYYQKQLYGAEEYGFDYDDMIYYASLYFDKITSENLGFQYVIVDEYQDISESRYEFVKKIVDKNHAKIVAVGDDWQTIYSFAGSNIEYVYNFQRYYPGAKLLKITKTYRNSQELIDYSGKFIMKNNLQIKKELVSSKNIENPIQFVLFKENEEYSVLKNLILQIYQQNKDHHIFILARTNHAIYQCFLEEELIDGWGTKIEFLGYHDLDIDGMTIHKSKGLTSDEVIVIGLDETFPSTKKSYWLEYLFKNAIKKESIPFAEERRVFYVALTRTKNRVFLLVNENPQHRSPFINEIYSLVKEKIS